MASHTVRFLSVSGDGSLRSHLISPVSLTLATDAAKWYASR
nr:hypothetical protein [Nostoc sp. DedQUE02]